MPKQNKELGYMLQKDQLFEWRSIYKNVTLGIELQRKKDPESLSQVKKVLKEYGGNLLQMPGPRNSPAACARGRR